MLEFTRKFELPGWLVNGLSIVVSLGFINTGTGQMFESSGLVSYRRVTPLVSSLSFPPLSRVRSLSLLGPFGFVGLLALPPST